MAFAYLVYGKARNDSFITPYKLTTTLTLVCNRGGHSHELKLLCVGVLLTRCDIHKPRRAGLVSHDVNASGARVARLTLSRKHFMLLCDFAWPKQ
jgi:hypothetical protein